MIPIKIHCGCGQKYAFDVEPVEGAMGYAVLCPVCGLDGTTLANGLIAEHLGSLRSSAPRLRYSPAAPAGTAVPPIPPNVPSFRRTRGRSGAMARSTGRLRAVCGGAAAVLILVGAVLFVRDFLLRQKARNSAALVKDGLPHTLPELNAWYVEPADGQNAAKVISDGISALRLANVEASAVPLLGRGKLPPLGGSMPYSLKSSLNVLIRSNREALQFFAQATRYDQCRYPVDFNLGAEATFPHLNKMIEAAQLLELAAVSHAEAKDAKASLDDVRSAFGLANSLKAEPYLFSQFVRARLLGIALAALEQSANRVCWTADGSAELLKELSKMEKFDADGEGFGRSVIAERVLSMSLLGKPEKFLQLLPILTSDLPQERRDQIAARLQRGKLEAEERFLEQTWAKLLPARQQPFPERLKVDELIREQIAEAQRKQLVLAEFLLPGLKVTAAKEARSVASLRLALTAVALEQFRAAHSSRYPATLSELAPAPLGAVPTDPYDGQPLRYKTKADGYVLYSLGPDLKDNLGQRPNGKEANSMFEVVIPPKPKQD